MDPRLRSAAVFVGMVMLVSVLAISQTPNGQSTQDAEQSSGAATRTDQAGVSKIPADQQPTREQLVKLFEVMRGSRADAIDDEDDAGHGAAAD